MARKKGTGQPDPAKDRGAHEAARGVKKESLRDLSRINKLDPHIQDMLHELDNQTDRGAALIASAMTEVTLTRLMCCRIVIHDDAQDILFYKEGAPLGSFATRIKVARAFGVIGPLTEAHLDTIRRIRNQFAHSPLKIDFTHKLIAAEIDRLLPDSGTWKQEWTPQRRRFIGTTIILMQGMEAAVRELMDNQVTVWTN